MLASSSFCICGQFLEVVGQRNPVKRYVNYTFSGRTFYWLSYPFYKIQKTVLVLEK